MILQQKIISELGVKPNIDPSKEFQISINFLKSYLKKNTSIHTLIVGISGGQDSTLVGKICQQSINELKQETKINNYQFIAVRLPYGKQIDEKDCQSAIKFIKPDKIIIFNIKKIIKINYAMLYKVGISLSDYIKGNTKARERMKIQYSIAGMTAGLVVGTNHASEAVTGFFTKYGDGSTDINPISRLNKRQGKSILQYLKCPKDLYMKIPTADLEDKKPLLPDETALGVTYKEIDDYLEGKFIEDTSAKIIEKWYNFTKHKRHLPITVFDNFWK